MRFVEYDDYYSIELRPKENAGRDLLMEVDYGKGILITLGELGGTKKTDKWMKLFSIDFDKTFYSEEDIYDFWSNYDVRFYTKKGSWSRHIPVADDIIDIGNDEYVVICWRNTGKKETLCRQIRQMEQRRRPIDVAFGYESPLIPLFASKLDKNISIKTILDGIEEVSTQFKNYDKESILDFGSWFFEMYFEGNSDLQDAIYKKWEKGPELFKYIDDMRELNWRNHYMEEYNSLSSSQTEQIDKVTDYIVSLKGNKSITFNSEAVGSIMYFLSDSMDKEEKEKNVRGIKTAFTMILSEGGGAIFRCFEFAPDGKDVVMAFRGEDGSIQAVSAKECKECMELQPDGSIQHFPNEIYKRASLIL